MPVYERGRGLGDHLGAWGWGVGGGHPTSLGGLIVLRVYKSCQKQQQRSRTCFRSLCDTGVTDGYNTVYNRPIKLSLQGQQDERWEPIKFKLIWLDANATEPRRDFNFSRPKAN